MSSTNIFTPFSEQELMPQEEKLEVVKEAGFDYYCIGLNTNE